MNRNFSLAILLLASVPGFAESNLEPRIERLENNMKKVRGKTPLGNYGAKTASASPQIDGFGFFLTADFLWWKLYEGGTDVCFKQKGNLSSLPVHGPMMRYNFDWKPGFKVGLGFLPEHDGWDLYTNFTYYRTHAHFSHSSTVARFSPLVGDQNNPAFQMKAQWHVNFYDIDFVIGRNFFVSKYLSLHPVFGISSAWIDQNQKINAVTSNQLVLKSLNDFWGIGPRLGFDAQFFLCENFSMYGSIAGDLLWGNFHVHEKQKDATTDVQYYNERSNLHRMAPVIGFNLGGAYETNFYHNYYHFLIKVGYENQYWWRQNQLPTFDTTSNDFERKSQDLSLQGLTLEVRLDF